jgi:hypothetical protein
MNFSTTKHVRVILPRQALEQIFDECDRFDRDETGGRVLGTYEQLGEKLRLHVSAIIDAGPKARRTAVSFFQDGEYQEKVFRDIERVHPTIEHLGNWHTHHVNGLSHLSGGDLETYHRTVNHENHNCPFFYALLVVDRAHARRGDRYTTKHYLFRRGDDHVYQIPSKHVEIVDTPLATTRATAVDPPPPQNSEAASTIPVRVYDRDVLREFYPALRPFVSEKLGVYWRGPVELVDGSVADLVVMETSSAHSPQYSAILRAPTEDLKKAAELISGHDFASVRAAVIETERQCNRAIYRRSAGTRAAKKTER